jgi:hypothetical protein
LSSISSKEQALQAIRDLPEDVTMERIEQRIEFLAAIAGKKGHMGPEKFHAD